MRARINRLNEMLAARLATTEQLEANARQADRLNARLVRQDAAIDAFCAKHQFNTVMEKAA